MRHTSGRACSSAKRMDASKPPVPSATLCVAMSWYACAKSARDFVHHTCRTTHGTNPVRSVGSSGPRATEDEKIAGVDEGRNGLVPSHRLERVELGRGPDICIGRSEAGQKGEDEHEKREKSVVECTSCALVK